MPEQGGVEEGEQQRRAAGAEDQRQHRDLAGDDAIDDLDQLRELVPHVMVGQTAGAGHFCQLEVPDQVNAMIERFLQVGM